MFHIRRLIYSDFGKNIISLLLGLGLATLFRKVCNDRNCIVFRGPKMSKIKNKIYKFNDKCYKYNLNAVDCDNNKKIVEFA